MQSKTKLPLLIGFLGSLALLACDKKDDGESGAVPPPLASSKPGACAQRGGKVADGKSAAFFPRESEKYCIDPNGETRAYGEEASGSLDEVCTQQFDGECEVYKRYGLKRVVTLRYIDGAGSPGAIFVTLSRFASPEGAYGFYTKRVVADGDPTQTAPAALPAGTAGALGSGIAYVWRGEYVAELSYTNELEPPDKLKESSRRVLPPLAQELGKRLPGDQKLPVAAERLPEAHRVPQGIQFSYEDVLDVSGVGAGAVGYYADGPKRWRTFVIVRRDEDSAKDIMQTFKKLDGAKALKDMPFGILRLSRQSDDASPRVTWLITRKDNQIFGVGDEEFVLRTEQSADEREKVTLSEAEKVAALKRLVL